MPFQSAWLSIIKGYEKLGPNVKNNIAFPYQGPADKPTNPAKRWPYTCGYGHLMSLSEESNGVVIGGKTIDAMNIGLTLEACEELLAQDVAPRIKTVSQAFAHLTDNEFGAFLDLLFNSGPEGLTKTPGTKHRAGHKLEAAESMLLYRKAGGVPLLGLWRRRLTDAVYYLSAEIIIAEDAASEKAAIDRLSSLLGKSVVKPSGLR